ncbi:MAG: hypothetical protein ABSC55_29435 [Syntrophorhabdales bacterium]|jgi:hypothetical protein
MSSQAPIVIQLQELAVDSRNSISDLLRKALLISTKLDLKDVKQWVLSELNGYKDIKEIPDYRRITGELMVYNPYHGYIPFIIPDTKTVEVLRQTVVVESVESLRHLLNTSGDRKGIFTYDFLPEQEAILMRLQDWVFQVRPTRVAQASQLAGILEKVRTRLLDWSLNLEAAGILGEGLTFSKEEKKKAETTQNIQIGHFHGILGDVQNSTVSQTMTMTITSGSFDSLAKYLEDQGVSVRDIEDLKSALQEDPRPLRRERLGSQVSSWIGKMVQKAADGSWAIGIGVAAHLLSTAIAKYYGL